MREDRKSLEILQCNFDNTKEMFCYMTENSEWISVPSEDMPWYNLILFLTGWRSGSKFLMNLVTQK